MIGWYDIPLTKLLQKNVPYEWGEEQQRAFEMLLLMLTQAPVLARPDFNKPFCVQTDASSYALGAVLTQNLDGEEHPIAYASQTLTKAERNYTVTEKECLAVLWAVKKYRGYLLGEQFVVITDHSSLLWLHNLKDPTGRLARWAMELQNYNMTIIHRKGALHKVPDALSRAFEDECNLAVTGLIEPDKWYNDKISKVTKDPHLWPDWKIENNLLYKHQPDPRIDPFVPDLDRWKLVVPKLDQERALFECHNTPESGHLGVDKTYHRLLQWYFWPQMKRDVVRYVKQCIDCQLHKVSQQAPMGLMGQRNIEGP